ncbi:hypothetical protein MMC20_006624 [Loxospora ochrophaea]|nr:hypothetical protein [Loxospora ochrophaea]
MVTLALEPNDFTFDTGEVGLEDENECMSEPTHFTFDTGDFVLKDRIQLRPVVIYKEQILSVASAQEGISIGDIELRKASVGGVFEEITYGMYEGKPVCFMRLAVEFQSTKDFRLQNAELHCQFDSDSNGQPVSSTVEVDKPRVLRRHPAEPLTESTPTAVSITHGVELNPHIEAAGFGGEGFKWANQETFVRNIGWEIASRITSSPGTTNRNRVSWLASGNSYQKTGPRQMIEIKILVEHQNEPFYALFHFKGKLNFGGRIGMLGKKNAVTCRRNFSPQPSSTVFHTSFLS